jgi:hypothetical protein
MTRAVIFTLSSALTARAPSPRAASCFKGRPKEAARVIADCAAQTHRRAGCDDAPAGEAPIQSAARLALYGSGF